MGGLLLKNAEPSGPHRFVEPSKPPADPLVRSGADRPNYNRQMVRSWDVAGDLPPVDLRPLISAERAELLSFLRSLDNSGWAASTANTGWNVHDVALHLLGSDLGRFGPRPSGAAREGRMRFDDLAELIESSNEDWVRAARRIAPVVTVELLAFIGPKVDERYATLDLDAPGTSVGWTGDGPTPCWLDIARGYTERWIHHAQMRLAVGAPPLVERRFLYPVLDTFMRSLPRAYEPVEADVGTRIGVLVEGEAGGRWTLRREADRWHLVTADEQVAAACVRIPQDVAWKLLSRTIAVPEALPEITIEGDERLGRPATQAVAIMTSQA
jgi:uncharacterized protein (TIGR03083 family)